MGQGLGRLRVATVWQFGALRGHTRADRDGGADAGKAAADRAKQGLYRRFTQTLGAGEIGQAGQVGQRRVGGDDIELVAQAQDL